MTSEFVKKIHLETAQRYQAQGYNRDALISHFRKVALDADEINELLDTLEQQPWAEQPFRARR